MVYQIQIECSRLVAEMEMAVKEQRKADFDRFKGEYVKYVGDEQRRGRFPLAYHERRVRELEAKIQK
jgi:hypothetical protein